MTREEEIFERALDFDSDDERRAFVAGACAGDPELAATVAELLAAIGDADQEDFLHCSPGSEAPLREEEGSIIGRYKLLQKLGEGGFGVVYMAEQREPVKRRVALKIIKLGMDTRHVVGRFEAERQALAMMDHPNIAKVLDAGATEHGRPYFVMELVRGIPVTQFCDEKQLSTEQRLELFRTICGAVQHAHQKGIIHRDLKPNNVLVAVGDDGTLAHPKVIDFGIAKATQQELTDKTLFTRFEDFVGTPAYMSPEQAEYSQLDIDTRTDIYSLGVLLYELLAGRTPFDSHDLVSSGVDEIRRRIREDEPPRPSIRLHSLEQADRTQIAKARQADPDLLHRKLRNEIDWIIMKAIEKDRTRRYGTAEALADDIGNYLNDAPVVARPPDAIYRLKKAIRRNRGSVGIAAVIVFALVMGAGVSTWQAVQTKRANERGESLLRDSYLIQATATRKTTEPGRHHDSLTALAKAAAISPSVEQRSEAIAAMATPDIRWTRPLDLGLPGLPHELGTVDAQGERYAIGTPDGEVTIFDYDKRELLTRLPLQPGSVRDLMFSPDGKFLTIHLRDKGREDWLSVWDLEAHQETFIVPGTTWKAIAFDRTSSRLAIGLGKRKLIQIFDLGSAEVIGELPLEHPASRFAFSPTGDRIAVTSRRPEIIIYELATGEEQQRLTHLRNAMCLAWHPDGERIAMGASGFSVVIFHIESGIPIEVMRGHLAEVVELEFHPGGRYLASAAWDGMTKIWEHRSGRCVLQTQGTFEQFLSDGSGIQMHLHKEGRGIWEFTAGSESISHFALEGSSQHKLVCLSFSPNSRWLVGTAKDLALWDLETGRRLIKADIPGIREMQFEGNGRDILVGGNTTGLRRYQIHEGADGGELQLDGGTVLKEGRVNRFTLSPDGHTIYTFLQDRRTIYALDAATGMERQTFDGQAGLRSVRLDLSGRWMATGCWHGAGIRAWDLHDLTAPPVDLMVEEDVANAFFSPDGKEMFIGASAGFHRFRTGTWDEWTERIPGTPAGMAFHPNKKLVALCRDGRRVSLFRYPSFELIAEFEALNPGKPTELKFSPDGEQLAMGTSSRDVTVWDLPALRAELDSMGLDWE